MASKNLPVRLLADEEMLRGSVRLDTSDGWVEDGPEIRLSRLQGLLDAMTGRARSAEHTSELQSLMRISYAVFCLNKNTHEFYNNIIVTYHKQYLNTDMYN